MSHRIDVSSTANREAALPPVIDAISEGRPVVLPTDTVYGIAVDAFNPRAVEILLAAKGRDRTMPPPVLIPNMDLLDALAAEVPEAARALAEAFWPGALTLIVWAQPALAWDLGETRGTVALRVPADEVALEVLEATGPLAVSSANRSGLAAATTIDEAENMLAASVAVYLDDGDRNAARASTIVDCTGQHFCVLREGAISTAELRAIVPEKFTDAAPSAPAGPESRAEYSASGSELPSG